MQTMLNVHEAKADFSNILANVESQFVTFTIMRYGKPIARLSPIASKRSVKPMRKYAGKVRLSENAFGDTTSDWEANNLTVVTTDRRFAQYGVDVLA